MIMTEETFLQTISINLLYIGIQNGRLENIVCILMSIFGYIFEKSMCIVVLEANRLEPRSGPTYVGPDLGSSLFAILQN